MWEKLPLPLKIIALLVLVVCWFIGPRIFPGQFVPLIILIPLVVLGFLFWIADRINPD
jgi:hypothetical protein